MENQPSIESLSNAASIGFADIQNYLTAIASIANNSIDNSPHGTFWSSVSYAQFINGTIPNVTCHGHAIPIINQQTPLQSSFYVILTNGSGFCDNNQMPDGGPLITDPGYTVMVNGISLTGQQIQNNIESWLSNGFPETATNV